MKARGFISNLMLAGILLTSPAVWAQTDLRYLRGVNATSNYGSNELGFKKAVLGTPKSIAAGQVDVSISRSTGVAGTWDLAAVKLSNVSLNGQILPSAGFWLSKNPTSGEVSLAFNPSVDASLQGISGFSRDVNIARSSAGAVDLSQVSGVSGVAKDYLTAVVYQAAELIKNAQYQVAGDNSLNAATLGAVLNDLKASILSADNRKPAYFSFLKSMNVEWIALTVPIFNDSIADPAVKIKYRPAGNTSSDVFTFQDEDLRDFIVQAKANDFKIALGFEFYPVEFAVSKSSPGCGTSTYKPNRWLLGQPVVSANEPDAQCINSSDWWWNPQHPLHASNKATFFSSLTQVQTRYAKLSQETGVDLFLLGTEQDNLFRTRSAAAPYNNHFLPELSALVKSVRQEYKGLVAVEQLWTTLAHPDWFAGGLGTAAAFNGVVEDLGLDLVALSSYFPLASASTNSVLTTAQLESSWNQVFSNYLVPLKAKYPNRPVIFSEWGYTNDVNAPFVQGSKLGSAVAAGDSSGSLQQANIIEAFFNTNAKYGNLVQGSFLYGVNFPDAADCGRVTFGVYCKAGAEKLANAYGAWFQLDANRILKWAEASFPDIFSAGGSVGSWSGFYFKYYPNARIYLAFKEGRVILHDGGQWNLKDVGSMRSFLDLAASQGF